MPSTTEAIRLDAMDLKEGPVLGRGAGSTIRAVTDRKTGLTYALKVVDRHSADDDIYINQALHEYEVARMLGHRNLLAIHDSRVRRKWFRTVGVDLLMEYVDGKTLDELPPVKLKVLVDIFRRVAAAMAHMHRRGVYHGDLKPGNIMLSRRGEVKVLDFGTAWIKGEDKGRIQGTPEYMAPEQELKKVVDERTDLYNLGATMYRMFTGEHANIGIVGLNTAKLSGSRRQPPAALNDEVPKELSDLIMRCLEARPERRPSGMQEVRTTLDAIAESPAAGGSGGQSS